MLPVPWLKFPMLLLPVLPCPILLVPVLPGPMLGSPEIPLGEAPWVLVFEFELGLVEPELDGVPLLVLEWVFNIAFRTA